MRSIANRKPSGLMPPMITSFKEDGELWEDGIRKKVNHLIDKGVHGLIPCGSTGEWPTLTVEEMKKVNEIVIDENEGKVPIYAGAHHINPKSSVELSKHAEEIGADGLFVITPYYKPLSEAGILAYFKSLKKEVDIPIMLYHNPNFSGNVLSPETIAKMYEKDLINSVKEAYGPVWRVHEEIFLTDDDFQVLYGHDINAFEAISVGADGWVAGIGNLLTEPTVELVESALEGDIGKARKIWYDILPIVRMFVHEWDGEPAPWLAMIKEGLEWRGVDVGKTRRYWVVDDDFPEDDKEILKKKLRDLDLL